MFDVIAQWAPAAIVIVTTVWGYFRLVRNNQIEFVRAELNLEKHKLEALQADFDKLKSTFNDLARREDDCQKYRQRLEAERVTLLMELRELQKLVR